MTTWKKFELLLWKNWLFRKREILKTIIEIILITLASIVLLFIGNPSNSESEVSSNTASSTAEPILREIHVDDNSVLLYTPDSNISYDLLLHVQLSEFIKPKIILRGVNDETELRKMALDSKVVAGISFVDLEDSLPSKLHYRIRSFQYEGTEWKAEFMMSPDVENDKVSNSGGDSYKKTLFLILQHLVASRFIELTSGEEGFLEDKEFLMKPFPQPLQHNESSSAKKLRFLLTLVIVFSYFFTLPNLIKNVVREKETGIKELMKIMGFPVWLQFCSWFVNTFITSMIGTMIIVLLLSGTWLGIQPVLPYTASLLFFLLLVLYISCGITFHILLSTFFSKPSVAVACGDAMWMVSFFAPYFTLDSKYYTLSLPQKMLVLLIPNMAVAWAIRIIICFETQNVGLNWKNLNTPCRFWDNLTMLHIYAILVFEILFFSIFAWYFDNILPSKYGTRKPWYFMFTKNYWQSGKSTGTGNDSRNSYIHQQEDSGDFEADPYGLTPSIRIINLTKSYGWRNTTHFAVNNITLNMYEGQITALLGHNGAGKTTTMSMLTGMYRPTSGTAYINNFDIRTQIDSVRKSLGLCPQQNMLFDILTVQEHLLFFGGLKIDSRKDLIKEIDLLMVKLQLWGKRNTRANKLSGGMKRKLNLGIALIGQPKVVMLDEPTSGLDPEARRAIWDLLLEYKVGSCILLSTHFMEEADVLADRIAIMANGNIICCGTPTFLKARFGAGYHIHIIKGKHCRLKKTVDLIKTYVNGSYVTNNNNSEFSMVLPADQSMYFADAFKDLEQNMRHLGIVGFGLSVSSVEEVFLRVGDVPESRISVVTRGSDDIYPSSGIPSPIRGLQIRKISGLALRLEHFIGLFLKRWYYTRRVWTLLMTQIFFPAFIVFVGMQSIYILSSKPSSDPIVLMDLSQYGETTIVLTPDNDLIPWYVSSIPPNHNVIFKDQPEEFMENLATHNFESYVKDYIVGASFENSSSKLQVTAWYNGFYIHSLPLSLNLLHNAFVKHAMGYSNYSLIVENVPFPKKKSSFVPMNQIISTAFYFSVGLSYVSCTFVIFPTHERSTMCKQMQLMTGLSKFVFWNVSFIWDFSIYIMCICIVLLVVVIFDTTEMCTGHGQFRLIIILLLLYGRTAVPLAYLVSLTTSLPATAFTGLSLVNTAFGMIASIVLFVLRVVSENEFLFIVVLLCEFLPNFTLTFGLLKILYISSIKKQCSKYEKCPKEMPEYFQWTWPGINPEIVMLVVTAILYFGILVCLDQDAFHKIKRLILKCFGKKPANDNSPIDTNAIGDLEIDVAEERDLVYKILRRGKEDQEVLLVNDLTKRFGKFTAVRGLNCVLGSAECFGLIGVNGAGKTTTFQMITGNLVMTKGDVFIYGVSITTNRSLYLENIGYCPQIDPLIDYLTGREILTVFAHLRGIPRSMIDQIVDAFIEDFDLKEHADEVTHIYSGGNKRKLSVALAFIGDPLVVCLDEPTTGVDPGARRKIRDILSGAKRSGKCVVLTSHSMEECEALCSRVGIMVDGQFRCLGGIQYLKNKYSQGFVIFAKLKRVDESLEMRQTNLQKFMEYQFPSAKLIDIHQGMVEYQIYDKKTKWAHMFDVMEKAKFRFNLEDYSVSQATLDQVFLTLARTGRSSK